MKKISKKKVVVVVMPAYNAAKTLQRTYRDIPKKSVDKIILVDDGSHDETVKIAKKLKIKTVVHPQNRGYGANQKTCYTLALSEGADIVVMIHPDYQHDATLTQELIRPILDNRADVMLGSRIRTRKEVLAGGMPVYKYVANRFLTTVENVVLGYNLTEYHTGFRAFKRETLVKIGFHKLSDNFVFDQQILIKMIRRGFRVGEIFVPVRYFKEASSIGFGQSVRYGLNTLVALLLDR